MTMETTDYVSYPVALALKKAGFDWKCILFYRNLDKELWEGGEMNWNNGVDCSAPTLWQAQKWLREKKGVLLWVYPDRHITDDDYPEIELTGEWLWDTEGVIRRCSRGSYPSYEQAILDGIATALELIEKKN